MIALAIPTAETPAPNDIPAIFKPSINNSWSVRSILTWYIVWPNFNLAYSPTPAAAAPNPIAFPIPAVKYVTARSGKITIASPVKSAISAISKPGLSTKAYLWISGL